MRLFPSLFGLLALLPACAQKHVASQTQPRPGAGRPRTVSTIPIHTLPTDTALVFQRTPCYGTCPSYTATVFRDGRVAYVGDRFVPLTGPRTASLPPATVTALLDEARRINFTSFKPRYSGNVSDLPGVILTAYLPGQRAHRVEAIQDVPNQLKSYLERVGSELDPLAGIHPKQ